MRVLQLCPLWFPISRNAAGGIETFLAHLAGAFEDSGCEVTLVAAGDSDPNLRVVPVVSQNLYDQMKAGRAREYVYYEQLQLQIALRHAEEFDIVHSHVGPTAYLLSGLPGLRDRVLHTLHGPVSGDLRWFVNRNPRLWFSTVSAFQARQLRAGGAQRCSAILNGIDVQAFEFGSKRNASLLFLGRIEYGKGPDIAAQTAAALGWPLILAGPIVEPDFFRSSIEPLLGQRIRYAGTVGHREKVDLLRRAGCVLMPSRCAEAFGMVALESMACGTPVVALANGALRETIDPGMTGFLAREEAEFPLLAKQALSLDRTAVRKHVESHFDVAHVPEKYIRLYARMLSARSSTQDTSRGRTSTATQTQRQLQGFASRRSSARHDDFA